MKKTLCIGNTTVDVIITINQLPSTTQDLNIKKQQLMLGGCPFNVFNTLKKFKPSSVQLCSITGSGIYGDFVKKEFRQRNIPVFAKLENVENGCCYCLVDQKGERTFMALHGAEYLFIKEKMDCINLAEVDSIYFCGLELEEKTGEDFVAWLETIPSDITLYFAPGPRFNLISKSLIQRIFNLHPILHINESEAVEFTNVTYVKKAAKNLIEQTTNTVIITCGEKGSLAILRDLQTEDSLITYKIIEAPTTPLSTNKICDTIGAGDSHIAAFIGYTKKGLSVKEALCKANDVSAQIVQIKGAHLPDSVVL